MFKSRFFKKSGKIAIMMVVAVMLFAAFVPGAFALNYNGTGSGSGNKAFNFFPETLNSNSYPAYNLSSGTYQLVVPGFDCEGTSP